MAQRPQAPIPPAPVPGSRTDQNSTQKQLPTFQVLRVVDDEIAIPHHGKVHGQVADVHPVVLVLRGRAEAHAGEVMTGGRDAGHFRGLGLQQERS